MATSHKTLTCPHCRQPAAQTPSPNGGMGQFYVGEEDEVFDTDVEMFTCSSGDPDHTFYTNPNV